MWTASSSMILWDSVKVWSLWFPISCLATGLFIWPLLIDLRQVSGALWLLPQTFSTGGPENSISRDSSWPATPAASGEGKSLLYLYVRYLHIIFESQMCTMNLEKSRTDLQPCTKMPFTIPASLQSNAISHSSRIQAIYPLISLLETESVTAVARAHGKSI